VGVFSGDLWALSEGRSESASGDKDDNAHIEQKNWTHGRKLLGGDRYHSGAAVEAINDLYGQELRWLLNLYLPSVKMVKKTRLGSKLRRLYDAPQTPWERVARSGCAEPGRWAELRKLPSRLHPFELARIIDRKLKRIYELANRRLRPASCPLHTDHRKRLRPDNGCGKDAPWESLNPGFSTALGNPAKRAGFPLSHTRDGGSSVTF
jgi:hypothetical protein